MKFQDRFYAVWKVTPVFMIFTVIMKGLYIGVFTATESAAVGVILVGLVLLFYVDAMADGADLPEWVTDNDGD